MKSDKLIFNGIKNKFDAQYLVLIRESDYKMIEIPIDDKTSQHILKYIERFSKRFKRDIENGNDEPHI